MTLLAIDGVLTETEPAVAWAVGPEDGFGWQVIWAPTEELAISTWLTLPRAELVDPDMMVATRVESFDSLDRQPNTQEWLAAGFATRCARCTDVVDNDVGANIVDEETVLCSSCAEAS